MVSTGFLDCVDKAVETLAGHKQVSERYVDREVAVRLRCHLALGLGLNCPTHDLCTA